MNLKNQFTTFTLAFLLTISAILISFSSLLAPYALRAWQVVFVSSLLSLILFWWRRARDRILQQIPQLLALQALLATGITQVFAANDLPSNLLPLHALPGQALIYLFIGGVAACGLTWLSLAHEEWASGGAALAAAGLYSSVIFFRVSAVQEVGYAYSVLAGFALLALLCMQELLLHILKTQAVYWKWSLAFIFVLVTAVIFSPSPDQSLNYVLYMLVMIGLAALVSSKIKNYSEWKLAAWIVLVLGAGLPVVFALIKAVSIVREFGLAAALAYRLHPSEMGGANYIARSIIVAAPSGAALLFAGQSQGRWKWMWRTVLALLQILILAVILYARSYEGYFAWLVALFVFAVLAGWKLIQTYWQRMASIPILRITHIGAGILLCFAILYTGFRVGYAINPYSFNARFAHWAGAFRAWQNHPLLGGGPDNEYLYTQYAGVLIIVGESQEFIDDPLYVIRYRAGLLKVHAHNLFLEVAAFTGFAGLITAAGMLATLLWIGFKTWRQTGPAIKILAAACLAGISGELAWGLLDVIRETPPFFSFPVWMIIGLILAAHVWSQPEGKNRTELRLDLSSPWFSGLTLIAGLIIVFLPTLSANRYSSGFLAFQEHRWDDAARNFRSAAMVNPLSAQNYWMLSKADFETGKWEQAEAELHKAISLKRGYSPYLAQAGWLAWLQGDIEAANRYFEEAIASDPLESWTPGLNANLGLLRVHQGRQAEAKSYFAKSLEYHPELASSPFWIRTQVTDGTVRVVLATDYYPNGQASSLKVRLLAHLGVSDLTSRHFTYDPLINSPISLNEVLDLIEADYRQARLSGDREALLLLAALAEASRQAGLMNRAERAYQEFQEFAPESAFGFRDLGKLYDLQGRFPEAQAMLERAVGTSPRDIDSRYALALAYLDQGLWERAEEEFGRILSQSRVTLFLSRLFDPELYAAQVRLYQAQGQWSLATQAWSRVAFIRAAPADYLQVAEAYLRQGETGPAAEFCLRAARALFRLWPRPLSSELRETGQCLARSLEGSSSPSSVTRLLQGQPFPGEILSGHINWAQGKFEGASAAYQRAAILRPEDGGAHYFLGEAYQALGQLDLADAEYRLAAQLDPLESLPWLALGRMQWGQGEHGAALASFRLAVESTPGWGVAHVALGNALLRLGNEDEASAHYQLAQLADRDLMEGMLYDFTSHLAEAEFQAPEADYVRGDYFTIGAEQKRVLFLHPDSRLEYAVDLAGFQNPSGLDLKFDIAMAPESWTQEGDGAGFAVYIVADGITRQLFSAYIDPKHNEADRRWHPHVIDLSAYAGKSVAIIFETNAGPAGDSRYDWAGWGEPRLSLQW